MKNKMRGILAACLLLLAAGCQSVPKDTFSLADEALTKYVETCKADKELGLFFKHCKIEKEKNNLKMKSK